MQTLICDCGTEVVVEFLMDVVECPNCGAMVSKENSRLGEEYE